jgi:membrane fusion protein, heavy metal efflux system
MAIEKYTTKTSTRRGYGVVLLAALILVALAAFVVRRQEAGNTPAPSPERAKPPADIVEATPEQLRQIRVENVQEREVGLDLQTTGKVGFNEDRMTPVVAPYGGRVLEVLANKGDRVKAGQPLLVVESADLVAAINDFAEAVADAEKAKITLDIAEKNVQRARNLHSLEALATRDLQIAESDLARAEKDYRRAQTAVSVVRNRLSLFGKSEDEVRKLEESPADPIDRRIEIRAPLDGTIVDRKVGPGQYIKPDLPDPLFLIGDLSSVWVNADVYEASLEEVHVGAPVAISVAAYPERQFAARISAINPTVDPVTRTIHVKCAVPNPDGLLKPEMFANVRIQRSAKLKVPAVPSNALVREGGDSFVLREDSAGRFQRRQVKPGPESQGFTLIEDGLNAKDRVVTGGVLLLSTGLGGK